MKLNSSNNQLFQYTLISIVVIWLAAFVFIPNVLIFITSFLNKGENELVQLQPTLKNYQQLFFDSIYAKVLWNSLKLALIVTTLSLLFAYPFAMCIVRASKKVQPFLLFLLIVPFWTNSLIRIYGVKIFLGAKGVLNKSLMALGVIEEPLRIMMTQSAVIIGLLYILFPFMVLPIYSSLNKLDKNYIEAARDLGANRMHTFLSITLPLTMPGVIAGILLVLLPAMGMFYVSDLLGGSKVVLAGNLIKDQVLKMRDWPFGAATSICLTIIMAILLLLYYKTSKSLKLKGEAS